MSKTGIFYGSTTGNTKLVAEKIGKLLENADVRDVGKVFADEIVEYDNIIMGTSTWGMGELQNDWEPVIEKLKQCNLDGKKVALFGCGDQVSYSESFVDAIGILYDAVSNGKAEIVGAWPGNGYSHSYSHAERNGSFVGLPIDEDNQANMTDERITKWVNSIKLQFK